MLIIFYDSKCPLCSAEMDHLKKHDSKNLINLVDLHDPIVMKNYPAINFNAAMEKLHGLYIGHILIGLEVTHRAWTLVGKGFWVAPLNWPVIKQISGVLYRVIARFRQPISLFLNKTFGIGNKSCAQGNCHAKNTDTDNRLK